MGGGGATGPGKGRHGRGGERRGPAAASGSEIGRSSSEMVSWRSRYVVSGRIRSAKLVISEWKASITTRNGILCSPKFSGSLARSMSCTLAVFMVEFHAMLDMNRISVSSAYGSWVLAVV